MGADVRKAANRINFNQPEEEFLDGDEAVGLGTLGSKGEGGRLRVAARNQKQKMTAATAKKYAKQGYGTATNPLGGRGAVSGLSSTIAFTPVQVCPWLLGSTPMTGSIGVDTVTAVKTGPSEFVPPMSSVVLLLGCNCSRTWQC